MAKKSVEPTIKEELETLVEEKAEDEVEKKPIEEKKPESFSKEELEEEKQAPLYKTLFWMILPVVLLIGAVLSGVFIYQLGVKKGIEMQQIAEPTPAPTPTPTPAPSLKRENLKVQVLNGAGVAGTAAKAKEFLEELGYKDVDAGNADSFDFEKTEIAIKERKKDYFDLLREDLSKEYAVSDKPEVLDSDSKYDAVITIGKKKAE